MTTKAHPLHASSFISLREKKHTPWRVALSSPSLQKRVHDSVFLLAERIHDPARVATIVEGARKQSPFFHWGGAVLANSVASIALFYLYLARSFPDQKWSALSQQYLQLAVLNTQQYPLERPGLFDGSSGFALILSNFYQDEPRYSNAYHAIHENIAQQVLQRIWKRRTPGVNTSDYDVIVGASGVLAYLVSIPDPNVLVQEGILKLVGYLMWLSGEDHSGRKNWFVPPELFPTERYREEYPDGYFNLGLSHGITGPLAALSLAWKAGYHLPGQQEAITELSRWIVEHQVRDHWGINWPSAIPLSQSYSSQQWQHITPARTAWCYGIPGIASALWHAGEALEDGILHQIAVGALEGALRRPIEARNIDSPTICHGMSGLLAICLRFAQNTKSVFVNEHIPRLVQQILDVCSPDSPLGVQDVEQNGIRIDDPSLLTGAIGVALALLAATTTVEPEWDRALLLS